MEESLGVLGGGGVRLFDIFVWGVWVIGKLFGNVNVKFVMGMLFCLEMCFFVFFRGVSWDEFVCDVFFLLKINIFRLIILRKYVLY